MKIEDYFRPFTIEEIAKDVVTLLGEQEVKVLRDTPRMVVARFHSSLGRAIRNEYMLWDRFHPLTSPWFIDQENGSNDCIVDDVDYHPCHPDAVSGDIIIEIWKILHK